MPSLLHTALALLLLAAAVPAQGKNLLFYGNSFSFFHGGVAPLVRAIAIEAGYPPPVYQERLAAGQDLHFHATDPAQRAAIGNFLPPGQTWDCVVLQGLSTEATQALGNPAQFTADAITILGNVRNHSPAARGVLYQTWARGPGHGFYPGVFQDPLAMHREIRRNYRLAIPALEAVFGPGTAVNSAAGDTVALRDFDPANYYFDLQHPAPELTVLASMCLFTSIYGRLVHDLTPDFGTPSPLGVLLTGYGLGGADWWRLAGLADTCAPPALQPYRGSGDQLLLTSGTSPGLLSAAPRHTLVVGSLLQTTIRSCNGVFAGAPVFLLGDVFPTGQPPVPAPFLPELAVDPSRMLVLRSAGSLQAPLSIAVPMSFSLPGTSILLQGLALAPSPETGNPFFVTTAGHELVFR